MTYTYDRETERLVVEPSYTVFEDDDKLHSKAYISSVENTLFDYLVAVWLDDNNNTSKQLNI